MNDADEIQLLRDEVDDLKLINMNLRHLIPEAVWMDEADRLRGDNQESPADESERLRSLITAWADAQDAQRETKPTSLRWWTDKSEAELALRKAIGRGPKKRTIMPKRARI